VGNVAAIVVGAGAVVVVVVLDWGVGGREEVQSRGRRRERERRTAGGLGEGGEDMARETEWAEGWGLGGEWRRAESQVEGGGLILMLIKRTGFTDVIGLCTMRELARSQMAVNYLRVLGTSMRN
jgi:hypothetical protein